MSKIFILDISPREIKNPYSGKEGAISVFRDEGFNKCLRILLAHAHKVDIDYLIKCWVDGYSNTHTLDEIDMRIPFSQFLQGKLNQGGKECLQNQE